MASGRMTKHMDTVSTITPTELDTKVSGSKTSNMARAKKFGQMVLNTRAITKKARKIGRAHV